MNEQTPQREAPQREAPHAPKLQVEQEEKPQPFSLGRVMRESWDSATQESASP